MGQITFDDLMKKQTCPICSKTVDEVRAWSSCPKHNKPVCNIHCFEGCTYHTTDTHCSYRDKKSQEKNTLPLPSTAK